MSDSQSIQFDQRFKNVVEKMRITKVLTVFGWAAAALMALVVIVACIDYFLETNWGFRAAAIGIPCAVALLSVGVLTWRVLRHWNRRATAAQLENRFHDLGQSVRTAVQFEGSDPTEQGVSPSLLKALDEDVQRRTVDLRLTEAVATGPLKVSMALLSALALVATVACFSSWDWRMAVSRALLWNRPYTTINLDRGDSQVDEKATFTFDTQVQGRVDRHVELLTRQLNGEGQTWNRRPLTSKDITGAGIRLVSYTVDIPRVKEPFEYQVVAGNCASSVHRVDVRYPLTIEAFEIELTTPDYTGLGSKLVTKGSFEAVEGSQAALTVLLDHAPAEAWLELRPLVTPLGEEPSIERVPLEIDGTRLTATIELTQDRFYEVFAAAADGTKVRPNRQRIRVHEDRPPKLRFQQPSQLTEVHPLAELLMKLKVSDDYGLRRAGIVFQRNDEDELLLEDLSYDDTETSDGRLAPQTGALIESMFPLEYFELSVKDSISYYGFAEDNRPGQINRNETDLHFIDVRPFRREFAQPQDGNSSNANAQNNNPNARNLPALNDMIARERFVLNRTMQMKRQDDRGKSISARAIDNLIETQNEGSDLTFQMAQAAEEIEQAFAIPEQGRISELLYQARQSMLESVDSLASAEFNVAKLQEKDALQQLINARQRLDDPTVGNGRNGAALRNAFRRMAMRRPRNDRERAREVVRRLREAAARQEFLMEKMADLLPPEVSEEMQHGESEPEPNETAQEGELVNDPDEDQHEMDKLRRELEQEQADLGEDIDDTVDMIEELAQISDLASQRTSDALSRVDALIGDLERDDTQAAMMNAQGISMDLRTLAQNIAGVTADEGTRRIQIARDLGLLLTDELRLVEQGIRNAERQVEDSDLSGDELTAFELSMASQLSDATDRHAEIAMTVLDILNSIVHPQEENPAAEQPTIERVQEVMAESDLALSVDRMQNLSGVIVSTDWPSSWAHTNDLADRFEIVSQRLDAMHREQMAPRLEQLRKLERRTAEARQSLKELPTDGQVNRWHLRVDGLLEDITMAKVAEKQVTAMQEAMTAAGWGSGEALNWPANAEQTALRSPADYSLHLGDIVSAIQRQIQEISLIDTDDANIGAVPVRYRHFVERYMEILSGVVEKPVADDGIE